MKPENALRFLAHEAARCHRLTRAGDSEARDAHTMLCLLLPALLKVCGNLEAMDDYEALAFEKDIFTALRERLQQEEEVPA